MWNSIRCCICKVVGSEIEGCTQVQILFGELRKYYRRAGRNDQLNSQKGDSMMREKVVKYDDICDICRHFTGTSYEGKQIIWSKLSEVAGKWQYWIDRRLFLERV